MVYGQRNSHWKKQSSTSTLQTWTSSLSFMQYTSLNIQMDVTAMLPDLTEHIRPVIHVFQLLLNFILDKGVKNF